MYRFEKSIGYTDGEIGYATGLCYGLVSVTVYQIRSIHLR